MKLIKFKLPSQILQEFGFLDFFQEVDSIEIVQIYQYDKNNFFSLQRIVLKDKKGGDLEQILKTYFGMLSYQVLEKKGHETLCIVKQENSAGFWPFFFSGDWGLIPPISITSHHIIYSMMIKEEQHFTELMEILHTIKSYEILSITTPNEYIHTTTHGSPQLTARQREIMEYATIHGYFEIPKKITVYDLANQFKITPAGVCNHIQKAEKALMRFHFG